MVGRFFYEIASNFTLVIGCVFLCIILSIYSKLIRKIFFGIIVFYALMFFSYTLNDTNIITIPASLAYLSKEILNNSLYIIQDGTIFINNFVSYFNEKFILFIISYIYEYLIFVPWQYNISIVQFIQIVKIYFTNTVFKQVDNIKNYIVDIRKELVVMRCWEFIFLQKTKKKLRSDDS